MIALGWIFFSLGLLGAALPLLPTTPFMLLALWAFSMGSERFHAWLVDHRLFGPPMRRWREERAIPRWAKLLASASMLASLAWLWLGARVSWTALAAAAAAMACGIAVIASFPSAPRR